MITTALLLALYVAGLIPSAVFAALIWTYGGYRIDAGEKVKAYTFVLLWPVTMLAVLVALPFYRR